MSESPWRRLLGLVGRGTQCHGEGPVLVESALGRERRAPRAPLVLFGNLGSYPSIAELIASHSTLSCALVPDPGLLQAFVSANPIAGLLAHSRMEHPGEAGVAIALVRRLRPEAFAIYQAWDYHVGRGAARALEYGADGLLMPAIEANEMLALVFGVLARKHSGAPAPASAEEHEALVRQFAPTSRFWGLQDQVHSQWW